MTRWYLQAGEKHPPFPKAIISEVPLKLPTVNGETAVGAQEEQYVESGAETSRPGI